MFVANIIVNFTYFKLFKQAIKVLLYGDVDVFNFFRL